jgi:hypothetical protein
MEADARAPGDVSVCRGRRGHSREWKWLRRTGPLSACPTAAPIERNGSAVDFHWIACRTGVEVEYNPASSLNI